MKASKELRDKNISEYLLYMFHIEDLLRALQFDREKIDFQLVRAYLAEERDDARDWYNGIAGMMKNEGVETRGHIHLIRSQINEAEVFLKTAREQNDEEILTAFGQVQPVFEEIRSRQASPPQTGPVEMALNIMYWYMVQKLAGNHVGDGQQEQIAQIASFLAVFSDKYRQYEKGQYHSE